MEIDRVVLFGDGVIVAHVLLSFLPDEGGELVHFGTHWIGRICSWLFARSEEG